MYCVPIYFGTGNGAKKLGKLVDRTEWDITPQTYNAYYNPSANDRIAGRTTHQSRRKGR